MTYYLSLHFVVLNYTIQLFYDPPNSEHDSAVLNASSFVPVCGPQSWTKLKS